MCFILEGLSDYLSFSVAEDENLVPCMFVCIKQTEESGVRHVRGMEEGLGGVRRPGPVSVFVALLQCEASDPMAMPRALGLVSCLGRLKPDRAPSLLSSRDLQY